MALSHTTRGGTQHFEMIVLRSDHPVFSDEVIKYLLLQNLGERAAKIRCQVCGFSLLDYRLRMLVLLRASRRSMQLRGLKQFAEEFTETMKERKLMEEEDTLIMESERVAGGREALNACIDLHFEAVKEGLAERPEWYWWHSFQSYRDNTVWPFVSRESVYDLFPTSEGDPQKLFMRAHLERKKKILNLCEDSAKPVTAS